MLILFLLCVIGIWFYLSSVSLTNKKEHLLDCFEHMDIELKKRYELITDIINSSQKIIELDQNTIDYIDRLRDEVIDLGLDQDYINRRIALDKDLENRTEQLLAIIESNTSITSEPTIVDAIKSYKDISTAINIIKQEYNTAAHNFRKAVEIFPTSFIARLKCIKSFDYIK